MKSINRIMILTLAAAIIVRFWLMPGINTATAQQYTRVYEDTDRDTRVAPDTTRPSKKVAPPNGPGNPEETTWKNSTSKKHKEAPYPGTEKYPGPGKKTEPEKRSETQEVEKYPTPKKYEPAKTAKPKKVYKKQTLRPKDKNVKLEAKMFSRAVQFVEEVHLDSTEVVVVEEPVSKAPF